MKNLETFGQPAIIVHTDADARAADSRFSTLPRCGKYEESATALHDITIHVKFKISALWATTMLCYIYGDLFGLFKQQTLVDIVSGKAGPLSTQAGLLAAAISVAISSVMVVLSLLLRPRVSRRLNIVLGIAYTVIIVATMPGAWLYYLFLGAIECVLTLLIAWNAWHWPNDVSSAATASQ